MDLDLKPGMRLKTESGNDVEILKTDLNARLPDVTYPVIAVITNAYGGHQQQRQHDSPECGGALQQGQQDADDDERAVGFDAHSFEPLHVFRPEFNDFHFAASRNCACSYPEYFANSAYPMVD